MSKRIAYLDDAKALGILLVILGHCKWIGAVPGLERAIYSFHMPLFFIISGFFISPKPWKESFMKYAKAYLVPYFKVSLAALLLVVLFSFFLLPVNGNVYLQWIIRVFYASGARQGIYTSSVPPIGVIWFLWALFWACSLYSILLYKQIYSIMRVAVIALAVTLSVITVEYIKLPLSIQSGLFALFYIWIGNLIRRYNFIDIFSRAVRFHSIFIPILLLIWFLSICVGKLDVGMCKVGLGPFNILSSIIFCVLLLYILRKQNLGFGKFLGKYTLSLLCGHFTIHYLFYIYGWPSNLLSFHPILNLFIEFSGELLGALILSYVFLKIGLLKTR